MESPPSFGPAEGSGGDATASAPRTTDPQSLVALVLGILAVIGGACGGGLLFGVPAIALGIAAHRTIAKLEGQRHGGGSRHRGRALASAGIGLGVLGALMFFAWASVGLFLLVRSPMANASPPGPPPIVHALPAWPAGAPSATPSAYESAGELTLHRTGGPLRLQLASVASAAGVAGKSVLVVTLAPECDACDEIERAMEESAVRAALARVRVVHVDIAEFRSELGRLRMDEVTAPWFYLVDGHGEPRDAIDADEWDDNVAENIAPVLGDFATGRLRTRRHAWHGGATL